MSKQKSQPNVGSDDPSISPEETPKPETSNAVPPPPPPPDLPDEDPENPFNPERLRKSNSSAQSRTTSKVLTVVPVGKPLEQLFFRVHSDPEYQFYPVYLIKPTMGKKINRSTFMVTSNLLEPLSLKGIKVMTAKLYTVIDRQETIRLWPIKDLDGESEDLWTASAHRVAETAMTKWVRLSSNMSAGAYFAHPVEGGEDLGEPTWPKIRMSEIMRVGFKFLIDSMDHPEIQKILKGKLDAE
jgi:hypothetical protein